MRAAFLFALVACVSAACGGGDDDKPAEACIDCDTAGVRPEHCADGFVHDAANRSCEPVLPDADCEGGTMAVLGKKECEAVGVAKCAEGFTADGKGGCNAVLPSTRCGYGEIAVPGDTTCARVAPCGEGTWGGIPVDATTIYVDANYTGTSDGTSARPHRTIQAAVDAATGSPLIAIAAGTYVESLVIDKPVRLHGVCPERVEITSPTNPTIDIRSGANAGAMQGVAVSGGGGGVKIGGASYALDRVWVNKTGGIGLVVQGAKANVVTAKGLLIERTAGAGIGLGGASLTLERSVIRGTEPLPDKTNGRGIQAQARATLVVKRSVIESNHEVGVFLFGADATIDGTLVRDTLPQVSDEMFGRGIVARAQPTGKVRATLTLTGSVLERNRDKGLWVSGADATIVDTVVRDTRPQQLDKKYGSGLTAGVDATTGHRAVVAIRTSVFEGNREGGVDVLGGEATIERTIVRGNLPRENDGLFGHGIHIETDEAGMLRGGLVARSVLVANNHDVGIYGMGSDITIEGSVVRATQPEGASKRFGRGINVQDHATTGVRSVLNLRASLIDANHESGVGVFSSDATIEACVVRDTQPQLANGEFGMGIAADVDPATGAQPKLTVKGTLIARNHDGGILAFGADATIEGCTVRDTRAQPIDGLFGDGIAAMFSRGVAAKLSLTSVTVQNNARAGVAVFGSSVSLGRSFLACNRLDMNLEPIDNEGTKISSSAADGGGNACGCGAARLCKGSSAQLTPATSLSG